MKGAVETLEERIRRVTGDKAAATRRANQAAKDEEPVGVK